MTYPQQPPHGSPLPNAGYMQPLAVGGAPLAPTPPPLATGGVAQGGSWPKMRHLQGCTIIIEPIRVDETKVNAKGEPQPEAHFHLTVVDAPGGKIQYGDSLDSTKPAPLAWERDVPCRFTGVNDYGYGPVNETRNALAAAEPARVGVVERGTQGNRPYLITKPDKMVGGGDRPDGQDRFVRASQVWAGVYGSMHGGPPFINPEPRSLLTPPSTPVAQPVSYQLAPAAPNGQRGYPAPVPPPTDPYQAWLASLPADQRAAYAAQQSAPPAPGTGPGI